MTQINKIGDIHYTIDKHLIELDLIGRYVGRPSICISKGVSTSNTHFWDFVFDAVIEAKKSWMEADQDEDWDGKPESIKRVEIMVEVYRDLEKALEPLVSHSRKEVIDGR